MDNNNEIRESLEVIADLFGQLKEEFESLSKCFYEDDEEDDVDEVLSCLMDDF